MKIITSATVFNDAVGLRLSATWSEVDDASGRVVKDNQRFDRVVTDGDAQAASRAILAYAGEQLDG